MIRSLTSQRSFWLASPYVADTHYVALSQTEYERIDSARRTLADAGAFERRQTLLIDNFKEMELFYARLSLDFIVDRDGSTTWASESIAEANRVLMNFLSSMVAYTDQVKRGFKSASAGATFKSLAKRHEAQLRKENASYEIASAIRNYAQHVEAPIASLSRPSNRSAAWPELISGFMNRKELVDYLVGENSQVDLTSYGDWLDTRALCYDSMRALSACHVRLRAIVERDVSKARSTVEKALNDLGGARTDGLLGDVEKATAIVFSTENADDPLNAERTSQHTIMLTWDDVRRGQSSAHRRPLSDYKGGLVS